MCQRARWRALGILLALLTVGSARGESLCLGVTTNDGPAAHFTVAPGDKLVVRFAHSLYGSTVEEEFRVAATGFRSSQLRYGEPRLVEFYGHDFSRQENGLWIVDPPGVHIQFLDVHASSDAAIQVSLGDHVLLRGDSTTHLRARLFVRACPVEKNG
jgi:hypothetical protein